ncbi:uncharacterized protein LOC144819163 [Lissotriton helveticus]
MPESKDERERARIAAQAVLEDTALQQNDSDGPLKSQPRNILNGLTTLFNTVAPIKKTSGNRRNPSAPWFSEDLRKEKQLCRQLERRWRANYCPNQKTIYKTALSQYKDHLIASKKEFYTRQIKEAKHSSKELFRVVNILTSAKSPGIKCDQELCDNIAAAFKTKVLNVLNNFQDSTPSSPIDSIFREHNTNTLLAFSRISSETITRYIQDSKSGSPTDPYPPKILKEIADLGPLKSQPRNILNGLTTLFNTVAPIKKTSGNRRNPSAPWFSEDLRKEKQLCRQLERRWRANYCPNQKTIYKTALSQYKDHLIASKKEFYTRQIKEAKHSSKELFRVVNILTSAKSPGIKCDQELCDNIAAAFKTKVLNVLNNFQDSTPSSPIDSIFREHNTNTLLAFSRISSETITRYIQDSKSGSPTDPYPPKILKEIADLKTSGNRRNPSAPWFSEDLRKEKQLCRQIERRWRANYCPNQKTIYKTALSQYKDHLIASKKEFYSRQIKEAKHSSKELFRVVNILTSAKSPGIKCDQELCDNIAAAFKTKVLNVLNNFQDSTPSSPIDSIFREHNTNTLLAFSRISSETITRYIQDSKSGSPTDPYPPKILKEIADLGPLKSQPRNILNGLTTLFNTVAPIKKTSGNRRNPSAPWFSEDLRKEKQLCRQLERRWRANYCPNQKTIYKTALSQYKDHLIASKKEFYTRQIKEAKHSSKELFRVVNILTSAKSPGIKCDQELCDNIAAAFKTKVLNVLNNFQDSTPSSPIDSIFREHNTNTLLAFSRISSETITRYIQDSKSGSPTDPYPPKILKEIADLVSPGLTDIFNSMFRSGSFPSIWKDTSILPLLKKPSLEPTDPNNYRPIARLPLPAKIIDKIMNSQLTQFINDNDLLDSSQFGFRREPSTETALIKATEEIRMAMDPLLIQLTILSCMSGRTSTPQVHWRPDEPIIPNMGNVTVKNATRHTYSFCYTYQGTDYEIQDHRVLEPNQSYSSGQLGVGSNMYVKYGRHSAETCRDNHDLYCGYDGMKGREFTIREIGWDRSQVELACSSGGEFPVCPNYGKMSHGEVKRKIEDSQRKYKEWYDKKWGVKEREFQEERRRAERAERERRIAEEIERESCALEEKMVKDAKNLKEKRQQREQNRVQERTRAMQYAIGGNTGTIEIDEENDVEEKFNQLLINYDINEDISTASKDIGERMQTLQQYLIARNIESMGLNIWCHGSLNNTLEKKMSLTEQLSLLLATAQVTLKDCDLDTTELQQYKDELDIKSSFLISILYMLHKTNKSLAGKLSRAVFSDLSRTSQDFLEHILFSGVWTHIQAVRFTLKAQESNISQEKMESILRLVQTYQIDINTTIVSLKDQDPLLLLQQHVKNEKDKDLNAIIAEMRKNNYPGKALSILDQVLSEVGARLPAFETLDLDETLKKEGIAMTRSIDFENPDIETLVKVLIGLCVAVQDTTTIVNQSGEKIEGYFPRMTQLAALLALLISKDPARNGCLLEIFTGEGKSTIVAMLALVHAIRGKKVDVITSSPVLARRDQEEWIKLYKMFDVSCSVVPPPGLDECTDSREIDKAIKKAYAADIVYGTVGNFAADILKQEFEKCKTRGDRTFDISIVDEVDYMTLDSGVQVTYLSHAATGMRHLEQLLAAIWAKMCTCQRIQKAKTGDILWATGTQYFHKVAAAAVMGPKKSEHFSSFDILLPGLQLGFFTEEDVKKLQSTLVESDQPITKAPQDSAIKELMDKLGPAQQRDLLSVFQKVLEDAVVFEYYEVKDGKASEFEISSTSDNKSTSDHDKICILLQEHGCACVVMSEKALIEGAVTELESRIRYSDTYQPPDKQENKDETFILLPAYLKQYTQNRMKVFVENAMKAVVMEKDREYMIESATDMSQVKSTSPIHEYHSIIPVDFKATGVLEKNKRWGDGLQQFLEMKHQLAISPLSNITNFMSNFHFLQRYTKGTGMFGVSGTLGDEAEVEFLKKHYNVSCYVMPTHRHTKKTELPTLQVIGGREVWIKSICEHVKKHTSQSQWGKGQAALVVCEDVKTAEKLQKELIELKAVSKPDKITLYIRSDKDNIETRMFDAGDVIIATNLGGRGTDVKISKDVNKCGGLFVILTHFPTNMRVEKQIFGRTSRKGNPGMVRMILNYDDLSPSYQDQPIEVMRQLRADYQKTHIAEMEAEELFEVQMREELFQKFCEHLNVFQGKYSKAEQRDIYKSSDSSNDSGSFDYSQTKLDYRPALNALKESWALWLTLHDKDIDEHKDINKLKRDLDQVIQKRADSLLRGESDNFYDFIKQALDRMYLHTQNKGSDYRALSFWQKAEKTDRVYRAVSLYNQAYITINLGKAGYMQKAMDLLKDSKQMMEIYISEVTNTTVSCQMSCLAKFEPHNRDDPNFSKQMQTRMSLFKSWIDYIDKSIAKLTELQKNKSKAITKDQAVFSLATDHSPITTDELNVLYDYGLSFVFEVEKKPEFCISALICFIIGALQVLAGILVCVFTCGTASQFGMGLISEGVSDMISGIEGMIKGAFDWAEWAISKAISIGLSLITAGFSIIKKAAQAVMKVTKGLLNGTKTFASLADDIIRSGKALISSVKTSVTSATSAISKNTLSKSIKTLASSSAMKKNFVQAVKYTGQEMAKQGVIQVLDYGMDEALEWVFKDIFGKAFKGMIAKSVKQNQALKQTIIKFTVANGVPEGALKTENPKTFQIRDTHKEMMNSAMEDVCQSAVDDIAEDYSTMETFFTYLDSMKDGILEIMKEAKAKGVIQKGFKLSVEVGKKTVEFVQMISSAPTQDMIENRVIPSIVKECDELESAADYKDDERRNFPAVEKMKDQLLDLISQNINDNFVDLLSSRLNGFVSKPLHAAVNKQAGKIVDNILGRNKTERFFIEQEHNDMEKTSVEGAKNKLSEVQQKELNDYVKKMQDTSCPATELDLNVLTKSDLMGGKGIKVIMVDENQKKISTEVYPGKDSAAGVITLQLQKVKKKAEGDSNKTNTLINPVTEKESLYKGQFNLVSPDGSVIPTKSGDNSLYQALAMTKGVQPNQDISKEAADFKQKVYKEVSEHQDKYETLVKRQLDFEKVYTTPRKYIIQAAGTSVPTPATT